MSHVFTFTKFGHILWTKDKYFEKNTIPVYIYDLNAEETHTHLKRRSAINGERSRSRQGGENAVD